MMRSVPGGESFMGVGMRGTAEASVNADGYFPNNVMKWRASAILF